MSKIIITNAITAVLTLGFANHVLAEDTATMGNIAGMEKCYAIAKAGRNDCGTKKHQCAGEAKLDADKNEWMHVPSGTCQKIVGGAIKPLDEA